MDKLTWYYTTTEEDDYKLHLAQYESARDYYANKGYDTQLVDRIDDHGKYTILLEVYEFETKETTNGCSTCS